MIKARAWPVKAMYILIAAALAISLIIVAAPAYKVSADSVPDAEWEMVGTPTMDGFVLAPESVIIDYALDADGEVAYAIVEAYDEDPLDDVDLMDNPDPWTNYDYRLLKSDDYAATWDDITDAVDEVIDPDDKDLNVIDELVLVATDWVDPDFVAVAVWWYDNTLGYDILSVFFSTDGGTTFNDADWVEDTAYFDDPDDVSDLAVSYEAGGKRDIAIGGIASDTYAALFRSTVTGDSASAWEDATEYGGWDDSDVPVAPTSTLVTDIIFSPNWGIDDTILVTTVTPVFMGDQDVHVQSGSWTTTPGWNEKSTLGIEAVLIKHDVDISVPAASLDLRGIAGITLPSDYNSKSTDTRVFWAWVNYWDGGDAASEIVRVDDDDAATLIGGKTAQVKNGEVWLTNVSYKGTIAEGEAIAGLVGTGTDPFAECCDGVQVYHNDGITEMDICCERWEKACKLPTGTTAMAVSYVGDDKAYAVALQGIFDYDEGAWSVTFDDGDTWNQLSLIDTWIDYLSDVAVSPDCNKTFLSTVQVDYWEYDIMGLPMVPPWVCYIAYDIGEGYYDIRYPYCDSVWLHAETLYEAEEYSGQWLRTWCGILEGDNTGDFDGMFPEYGLLRLAPEETTGETVILVDRMSGNVYWDDLEGLGCWDSISSTAVGEIVDLAAEDADTLFALDASGDVAMFDEDEWDEAVASEVDAGWTIAVWGDWILVGGQDGDVSYSDDGGETFTELEDTTPIKGYVTVAFDSYFDSNDTIYAAVASVNLIDLTGTGGIYSWIIGESTSWMDLKAEPLESQIGVDPALGPTSGDDRVEVAYTGLVVDNPSNPFTDPDNGGVIYASYIYNAGNTTDPVLVSGAARSLEREVTVCTTCLVWDYLIVDLEDDGWDSFLMVPDALKICGCLTPDTNSRLFAIGQNFDKMMTGGMWLYDMDEGEFGTAWTFEDCYGKKAPDITSPADEAVIPADPCSCYSVPFTVLWDTLCDACSYDIAFALDEEFTMPVSVNEEEGLAYHVVGDVPSYSIMGGAAGGLSCETTYYVRVRAADAATGQIIHSWWSDPIEITIAPSVESGIIDLVSPAPGATGVGTKNVGFSWALLATADKFDWVLDDNSDFSSPVESKTGLPDTAYGCTKTLSHDTTYYWQVTAYNEGAAISTSAVGTFTTGATGAFCCPQDGMCFDTQAELEAYNAEHYPSQPATPFWVWVVIGIGAVLVIVVIVLIFRTRRV